MRRTHTPIDENMKAAPPHQIHTTHYGYFCPIDTPDGGNVGLVKHLAVLANVTVDIQSSNIISALKDFGMKSLTETTP